jgi:signal transduction histidine kinase
MYNESDRRKLAEAALRSITASTSRVRGEEFLRVLVKDLATALEVTYVIAGRVATMPDNSEGIRTLAVWAGNDYAPNMEYGLTHTPCHDVTEQSMCFHSCNIQADYPLDTLLVEMQAESYVGMPMIDTEGKTLGILSAIDTKPIDENKHLLALSLVSIFAARAAAELQHQDREQELERKVAQRTEALRQAQTRLVEQEKMAALGALVAGIAHELNTPIGNGLMAASTLQSKAAEFSTHMTEGISRSNLLEFIETIQNGAGLLIQDMERAANLVSDFKQIAIDQADIQRHDFFLDKTLTKVLTALQPAISKSGHLLECDIPAGISLNNDETSLEQVLNILIDNALVHAFDKDTQGKIHISMQLDGSDNLLLHVRDDGIGISPENLSHIFEPFFTTIFGQGRSGLGLHIAYNLVNIVLRGTISVESAPQQGSCFTLRLARSTSE